MAASRRTKTTTTYRRITTGAVAPAVPTESSDHDNREYFMDPAIAQQLSIMAITAAQNQMALNGALDRNLIANVAAGLTLAIQQTNMASLYMLTSTDPMAAASAADLFRAAAPLVVAGLNTAAKLPS
jgi:hypothetical protein